MPDNGPYVIRRKAARDVVTGNEALIRGRYRPVLNIARDTSTGEVVLITAALSRAAADRYAPGAIVRTRTNAPVRRRNR